MAKIMVSLRFVFLWTGYSEDEIRKGECGPPIRTILSVSPELFPYVWHSAAHAFYLTPYTFCPSLHFPRHRHTYNQVTSIHRLASGIQYPVSSIQNPATCTLKSIAKQESLEVCIEYIGSVGKMLFIQLSTWSLQLWAFVPGNYLKRTFPRQATGYRWMINSILTQQAAGN